VKRKRIRVASWIGRQRPAGTRYWHGKIRMDEGEFEQETLICNASDFEVGALIVCREPIMRGPTRKAVK